MPELSSAGTGKGKLEAGSLDLLVHDIEKFRSFLDFIDNDPFSFSPQSC
jgi:hypothetical protein